MTRELHNRYYYLSNPMQSLEPNQMPCFATPEQCILCTLHPLGIGFSIAIGILDSLILPTTHTDETTIRRMQERLRIDLAIAQIFRGNADRATIFCRRIAALDDSRQDLAMTCPYHLTAIIHRHRGGFPPHLDDYSAIIKAHRDALSAALVADTPRAFQT